jgi:hypothetical protein
MHQKAGDVLVPDELAMSVLPNNLTINEIARH